MVAFIGAVICIIAAVHTGSSRAAASQHQPPADNHSLYPETAAQTPAAGGSAARSGSLGAFHGSETPDSEAPTFKIGLGGLDGVTGLTGHDPTVSRLICTPIPVGECNPKNFHQQADEPLRDDSSSYLRTTADELRRTVLQQKDQILADQRTIRELTGKLSECEKGLNGRGSPDRRGGAVGLLGVHGVAEESAHHPERIMVRDSPSSAADSVHLLAISAVDELEQAITQLKDRIEKLEAAEGLSNEMRRSVKQGIEARKQWEEEVQSDIGPFSHIQTGSNTSGVPEEGGTSGSPGVAAAAASAAGVGGDKLWRMEDLEGELRRKVELLDKERKSLRLEAERQRQEIDRGINKLHHRLSGLEDGILGPTFPEGFRLSFPTRTNYMYAVVKQSLPILRAFTVCLWLRPAEVGIGTPLSYAVPSQPNELVLLQGLHTPTELLVNDKVAQLPLNLSRGSWQHICVSWSQKGGAWQAYQGGKLRGEGHALAAGHHIRPGGVFILGQEQDSLGGGFDSSQALVGELSQVGLWDRVLPPNQVASLARCGRVSQGSVASWSERGVEVHGGATKDPGEPCSKHNRSSH